MNTPPAPTTRSTTPHTPHTPHAAPFITQSAPKTSRRTLLTTAAASTASAAAAALALPNLPAWAQPAPGESIVPFLDDQQPDSIPNQIIWKNLTPQDWHTPADRLYLVTHYGIPEPITPENWSLDITGLIDRPTTLNYQQLIQRPVIHHHATIECGGNGVNPGFMGAVANIKWTGTPLMPLLNEAGLDSTALEAVCFGRDSGDEEIRGSTYKQHFARSLPLRHKVMDTAILCYHMNDQPLDITHGAPVRLVVPGWYGVAWVKWINRIDITDRRYVGRFMSKDYVTLRGEQKGDQTIWHRTLVGPMNVKSIIANIIKQQNNQLRFFGAAWSDGTPLKAVEISIDQGPWQTATLQPKPVNSAHTWSFFQHTIPTPPPGKHTIVSRAIDEKGRIQPTTEDPAIALKQTYWEANQQVPRAFEI